MVDSLPSLYTYPIRLFLSLQNMCLYEYISKHDLSNTSYIYIYIPSGPLCATVPMALMNICFSLQMLIMTEANSNVIVPLQVLWTIGVGLQLFCMVTFILINLKKYFQSTLCWDIVNPAW